jgi:hypothetical protein
MKIKQILIILVIVIFCSIVSYRFGVLAQISGSLKAVVEPGSMVTEASYVIFTDGSTIYARNGQTGEIEFSGADAATVIQSAINAVLASTYAGSIYIREGLYLIGTNILISAYDKSIIIAGAGKRSTVFQASADINVFTIKDGVTAHLRDLKIDMNNKNGNGIFGDRTGANSQSCNIFGSIEDVYIENVKNNYWGIYLINPSYMYIKNIDISTNGNGLLLENNRIDGINRGNSHISYVNVQLFGSNCAAIKLNSVNVSSKGMINLNSFTNIEIEGFGTNSNQNGIVLYDSSYNTFTHIDIEDLDTGDNIQLNGSGISSCKFNTFTGSGYQSVSNNFIHCIGSNARGNIFRDMHAIGSSSSARLIYEESLTGYDGNTYENIVAIGTNWDLSNLITIQANSHLRGTTGRGGATSSLKYSENSGTATVNGAVSSVTVNHGLAITPKIVTVTPQQSGQGKVWVTNKNTATFTINFDTQSGASTWYFDWYAEV